MQANSIVQAVLFFILLGLMAYVDIKRREIPGTLCVLMALISLIDFEAVNIFGILAALPFFVAAMVNPSGMGGGDIKLTAAAGLVLGLWKTLIGVAFGLTAVIVFHGLKMLFHRIKYKGAGSKAYPLAPFLMLGFICAYFF